jgi:hypothetical protein
MAQGRNLARTLLLLPLVLLLAACWESEHPLIDASHAARLPIEGTYRSPDPAEVDTIRVTSAADGGYLFDDGKDTQRVLLAQLGGGWALAQWQIEKAGGDERFYTLIRLGDDRLTMHYGPCDESLDGIAGIERKSTTCTFSTFAALSRVASNTVRDLESGKADDDAAVLLRK